MSVSPAERTQILAQIAVKEAQLAVANDAYMAALKDAHVQSYSFDSGEGKQATTRRKPSEIYADILTLENDLLRLRNRLVGGGIINMSLRRRS